MHLTFVYEIAATSSFGMSGINAVGAVSLSTETHPDKDCEINPLMSYWTYRHCWPSPAPHECLREVAFLKSVGIEFAFNSRLPAFSFLQDHIVLEKTVFPAAAMIEVIQASWSSVSEYIPNVLTRLIIEKPKFMTQGSTYFNLGIDLGKGQLCLSTPTTWQRGERCMVHCQGQIQRPCQWNRKLSEQPVKSYTYADNCKKILPSFVHAVEFKNFSTVDCKKSRHMMSGFVIHPAEIDAAMHLAAVPWRPSEHNECRVPVSIQCVRVLAFENWQVWTIADHPLPDLYNNSPVNVGMLESSDRNRSTDRAFSMVGLEAGVLKDLSRIRREEHKGMIPAESENLLYSIDWVSLNFEVETLQSRECVRDTIRIATNSTFDLCPDSKGDSTAINVISIFQRIYSEKNLDTSALLTRQFPGPSVVSQESSDTSWVVGALVKVLGLESANQAPTLFFIDKTSPSPNTGTIEKASPYGMHLANRLILRPTISQVKNLEANPSCCCIRPEPRGSLGNLKCFAFKAPETLPMGCSFVEIMCVGLNFRDVLNVLGMYPGDAGDPGSDFAGIIVKSEKDSSFAAGDRVFGIASGCLATHCVMPNSTMVPVPPSLSYSQAASLPTTMLTAMLCLNVIRTSIPHSETLVHAASGGLGLSLLQIASSTEGWQVSGTASSPSKRTLVRQCTNSNCYDSRSLKFVEEVVILSSGNSCSSVINSLTSPGAISASLSLLCCGGTFIEVGKRDIWSSKRVAQERPDLLYNIIAIDFISLRARRRMLQKVASSMSAAKLTTPVMQNYSFVDVLLALRRFSSATHIGKVVSSRNHVEAGPGSWVISGGMGALGLLSAKLMTQSLECRSCVLLGRSGRHKQDSSQIRAGCAEVVSIKCDISQTSHVFDCLERNIHRQWYGILHSGGLVKDSILPNQTLPNIRSVCVPKASGTKVALQACLQPIQAVKLFSSIASSIGGVGQANYAAANAILDAAAHSAQRQGMPIVSMNWGAWSGLGMASKINSARLSRLGLGSLSSEQGISILRRTLLKLFSGSGVKPSMIGNQFNWNAIRQADCPYHDILACVDSQDEMPNEHKRASENAVDSHQKLLGFHQMQRDALRTEIMKTVAFVLGYSVHPDAPLIQSGIDSLGAVELRNELITRMGIALPSTIVFDYPTIEAMTAYVEREMRHSESESFPLSEGIGEVESNKIWNSSGTLVAITKARNRLPCHPTGDDAVDRISTIPHDRWDIENFTNNDSKVARIRFGGFVSEWSRFDADAFFIKENEAIAMDPQQRLLLEDTAGLAAVGTKTVVAVAIAKITQPVSMAKSLSLSASHGSSLMATGHATSVAAGRLSFTYNLNGPSISIDTACSSGLVALQYAHSNLRIKNSDQALVAGVSAPMDAETTLLFAAAGMMATDGRCKTLDAKADGYVRSEGCLVMALKTIASHEGNNDVLSVVAAAAVNQDGRSSSLTAPHGPSQQAVLTTASLECGSKPGNIEYFEIHGTGTSLGDPIEIGALCSVVKRYKERPKPRAGIGTSKSQLGHAETVAGLFAVERLIGNMVHKKCPESLHVVQVNAHLISFLDEFQLYRENATNICVAANGQLLAGASSFAFQGTNAHCILWQQNESCPEKTTARRYFKGKRILHLSPPHHFLESVSLTGTVSVFATDLRQVKSSYLLDHIVYDRNLLPGVSMLDGMLAAVRAMLSSVVDRDDTKLFDGNFMIPFVLSNSELDMTSIAIDAKGEVSFLRKGVLHPTNHCWAQVGFAMSEFDNRDLCPCNGHQKRRCLLFSHLLPQNKNTFFSIGSVVPLYATRRAAPSFDATLHLASTGEQNTSTKAFIPSTVGIYDCIGTPGAKYWKGWAICRLPSAAKSELVSAAELREDNHASSFIIEGLVSLPFRAQGHVPILKSFGGNETSIHLYEFVHHASSLDKVGEAVSLRGQLGLGSAVRMETEQVEFKISSCMMCDENFSRHISSVLALVKSCTGGFLSTALPRSSIQQSPVGSMKSSGAASYIASSAILPMLKTLNLERLDCVESLVGGWFNDTSTSDKVLREPISSTSVLSDNSLVSVPRLRAITKSISSVPSADIIAAGCHSTFIITGASGSLGKKVAAWIVTGLRFAKVLLLQRHTKETDASFTNTPIEVESISSNLDHDSLDQSIQSGYACPVFFHCAGILWDGMVASQTAQAFRVTHTPKLAALRTMSPLLEIIATKTITLFSSIAALFGNPGQANYSAANGTMDGWCSLARAAGLSTLSVQWGPWAGGGMATQAIAKKVYRSGLSYISPESGLHSLAKCLSFDSSLGLTPALSSGILVAAEVENWKRLFDRIKSASNMFNALVSFKEDKMSPQVLSASEPWKRLDRAQAYEIIDSIMELMTGTRIEQHESFVAKGIDSLGSIELRNRLSDNFCMSLPTTVVYDFPTPLQLVDFMDRITDKDVNNHLLRDYFGQQGKHHMNVTSQVKEIVNSILGKDIDHAMPLMEGGVDSLAIMEVNDALERTFGVRLWPTFVFDFPTIDAITSYVLQRMDEDTSVGIQEDLRPAIERDVQRSSRPTVHVTMLACRYPGEVFTLASAAKQAFSQFESHSVIPTERWSVDQYYNPEPMPSRMYVRSGYWLRDLDAFDSEIFRLSVNEATTLDPQIRILMELAYKCLREKSNRTSTGVYIGCMYNEYLDGILAPLGLADSVPSSITGQGLSFMVGRLSYTFALNGPCASVDTACSSSLVALHLGKKVGLTTKSFIPTCLKQFKFALFNIKSKSS